jgi:GntR family transcriptional regulator
LVHTEKRTRWAEVAADLAVAIEKGRFPVGSDLPAETELCAMYGVSRFTVRESLRRLADSGLITRRHGSGSRVVATSPAQAYLLAVDSETDILRYASDTAMTLSPNVRQVPVSTARTLALGDAMNWIQLSGVRELPGGQRIGLAEVYLRAEHRAVVDELENPVRGAIYSHILRRHGLTLARIDQTIGAVSLRPGQARRLRAAEGEPALRIIRRYNAEEAGTIEVSVHIHPASRFEYSLSIDPVAPQRGLIGRS